MAVPYFESSRKFPSTWLQWNSRKASLDSMYSTKIPLKRNFPRNPISSEAESDKTETTLERKTSIEGEKRFRFRGSTAISLRQINVDFVSKMSRTIKVKLEQIKMRMKASSLATSRTSKFNITRRQFLHVPQKLFAVPACLREPPRA